MNVTLGENNYCTKSSFVIKREKYITTLIYILVSGYNNSILDRNSLYLSSVIKINCRWKLLLDSL